MRPIRYLFLLSLLSSLALAQPPKLQFPIEGQLGRDFFIVNYVDHDSAAGKVRDYNCSDLTYDGHQGTDFVLRNFRQMDSGVAVLAAADGVVFAVYDTAYDRNKVSVPALGFGNWVGIAHAGGLYTYYAHIRKNSAVVKAGDTVKSGQKLALVGSAGNATDPHVHLEVWTKDTVLLDPFGGPCNAGSSLWLDQPPYDTSFAIIDHGMLGWVPTLDTLRERPPTPASFASPDTAVSFWIHERGLRTGDSERIEWYTPDGSLWFSYDFPALAHDYAYYYFWSYINLPATAGQWSARYLINGKEIIRSPFTVAGTMEVKSGNSTGGIAMSYDRSGGKVVTIKLSEEQIIHSRLEASLFDAVGRRVASLYDGAPTSTNLVLPLASYNLPNGIYYLRIVCNGLVAAVPVVW